MTDVWHVLMRLVDFVVFKNIYSQVEDLLIKLMELLIGI